MRQRYSPLCCACIGAWVRNTAKRGPGLRNLSTMRPPTEIFDRMLKRRQRDRMAVLDEHGEFDYLRAEVAARLVDRLRDVSREFPVALDLGSHAGHLFKECMQQPGVGGIQRLVQMDLSEQALLRAAKLKHGYQGALKTDVLVADEEFLPFGPHTFDLVMSMSLHWVNDIPSTLRQIREILKPDGAFVAAIVGGNTLTELRHCLYIAEQEREGGMSPHTSPLTQPSDVAGLVQGAGFGIPTVDVDTIQIGYSDMFTLMRHLQGMGEANASHNRRGRISRDTLLAAASLYKELYSDGDDGIVATFQIIYIIGWSPAASQPKPKRRGSAQRSLKELGQP